MKLYVVGHGFMLFRDRENRQPVRIPIPNDLAINFYCDKGALFDSGWEKPIVDAGGEVGDECPIEKARDDWKKIVMTRECDEHLLTRPGKMRPYRRLESMKKITPNADGTHAVIEAFGDGDTLYIASEESCTCRLSAILSALAGRGFTGTLHWLACRSPYPDYDSQESREFQLAVLEQACAEIDVIKLQPVLPRRPQRASAQAARVLDYAHDWASDYPSIEERGVT